MSGTPVYAAIPRGEVTPGHDLERNAGVGQRFGFFAAAPEDERIAALQANDIQTAFAPVDEKRADLFLRERVFRFFLADVDALGGSGREVEQIGTGEVIVENAVGVFEQAPGFDGDEFRIARSRADQIDLRRRHTDQSRAGSAS